MCLVNVSDSEIHFIQDIVTTIIDNLHCFGQVNRCARFGDSEVSTAPAHETCSFPKDCSGLTSLIERACRFGLYRSMQHALGSDNCGHRDVLSVAVQRGSMASGRCRGGATRTVYPDAAARSFSILACPPVYMASPALLNPRTQIARLHRDTQWVG